MSIAVSNLLCYNFREFKIKKEDFMGTKSEENLKRHSQENLRPIENILPSLKRQMRKDTPRLPNSLGQRLKLKPSMPITISEF